MGVSVVDVGSGDGGVYGGEPALEVGSSIVF
jgi:hypothetical protein